MVENFITLNGMPGTGKTTLALLLHEEEDYEIVSVHDLHISIAKKLRMDTEDFIELINSNSQMQKRYDKMVNRAIREKEIKFTGKKVVFNTRASFSLIKNAVHILLLAEPDVATERLYSRYEKLNLHHNEIKDRILKISQKETHRFSRQINAEYLNPVHYDIVIDTTNLSIENVKNIALHKSKEIMTKRSMELLNELTGTKSKRGGPTWS